MTSAAEAKAAIEAAYRARTAKSAALHREAERVMPGGVTRSITHYLPYPARITEGRGCRITDADGNGYIDHLNNFGSMIHGHAHLAIVEALRARFARYGRPMSDTNLKQGDVIEAYEVIEEAAQL